MELTKELFGLFLLSAFMLIFPGMVNLCDCAFVPFPTTVGTTYISVFSGEIELIENTTVKLDDQPVVRTTYFVAPQRVWLGLGPQKANFQLPRLNSTDSCHTQQGQHLFVVFGQLNQSPNYWGCFN
ncbi:MAG: hypothetical protein AAGD96_12550 [Chloroflexota bacterium]